VLQRLTDLDLAQEPLLTKRYSELGQQDLYGNVLVVR
jgi:hypothetical protein